MDTSRTFSSNPELANFVVSSGVLNQSLATVQDLHGEIINQNEHAVRHKVSQQSNCTIIAFSSWPGCGKDYIQERGDLVSSSTPKEETPESFALFNFLSTKTNPDISINKAALELFASIRDRLPTLKSQIHSSKVLIITGNSLGGSVAILFTLWLLETIDFSITKRPLCITFGSPLVGDNGLQNAILKYPTWNSCFLHVVSDQDPIPRVLISPHNPLAAKSASQTNVYKPFGTFLLYSKSGCGCFEDSQTILELLMATYSEGPGNQNPNQVLELYRKIVEYLSRKVICRDNTMLLQWTTPPQRAGIIIQLVAIGLTQPQLQGQNNGLDNLIAKIEKQETKFAKSRRQGFDPSKKLNDMEINMAYLEWYKKYSKEKGIGYYDSYKNPGNFGDLNVVRYKKILTCYWEEIIDEVEKKPQKEGAYFRTRWLFAGTIYRRMIEPLDIAEYYNKGLKDYINQGRPKHYKQLEQWLKETEKPASNPSQLKKQNVASNLTEDSCFWAHVEEARISCQLLSSGESSDMEIELKKLRTFENYVYGLMKYYAVSPEILLPRSSFMQCWKEYKEIMGTSYSSNLSNLMKNYDKYYDKYAVAEPVSATMLPSGHEHEIMPISLEKHELLSAHGTEVMEEKGGMPIIETDVEISDEEGRISISEAETESSMEPSLSGSSKLVELPEPEIMPSSLEKYELLSAHGMEVMEEKGKIPILDTEIETLPSQPKEEGWTEFKLPKHAGEPIEPLTALAASTSGTSKCAVGKPVSATMLPSGTGEIEIAPIDGQPLLKLSTCLKRSIERTSLHILRCMSDVTARRIGVHGSDGIGKTSVLKALINHPIIKDLFDVVIWVTVSRNWSTRKVQDEVLQQLSLSSKDLETDYEIAKKLFQVLKSQRFLLLLDDVWERIDLNAVGIPNPTLENSSRIILATRSPDVCHIMAADREVPVERLSPEEAWELFQEQVGGVINCPNIQPYARDMVQKCGGLPLLIIVTGRAMAKENDALRWMHASREFSRCSAHVIYGLKSIVQQMKFSYDRLEGPDLKSCLLYCALLPEDQEISVFELVEYWIEEGLISGNRTDTYKRGYDIVGALVEASLLQSSECGLSIKMHDLIRDLALGILSLETEGCHFLLRSYSRMTQLSNTGYSSFFRPTASFKSNQPLILYDHQFLSRAGAGLTELSSKEKWEEAKMIFLMDNELSSLPDSPSCPKLLALFLQRNHKLRVIPTSFFDLMPFLTVLNLSKTRIKSLPKSLCKLVSLEVLILRDCERLVLSQSEVEYPRRLEVLDLQGTEINKFPKKISELSSLIYLKVSFYGSVNWSEYAKLPHELVSRGMIANLLELETLSIDVYPGDRRWNKNVKSVIDEVGKLKNLTTFCCYFPEVEFLKLFLGTSLSWKIGGLTEFKFVVGHDAKRFVSKVADNLAFDNVPWDQCLRFVNGEGKPDAAVKEVLTRTTAFYLDHHINVSSLSEFGVRNLDGLRSCVVRECPKIETIIASKELSEAVFPILEHLIINYLSNLRTILEGMIPPGSFAKLRKLTVHTSPKLQFVFASSMLHFFSNLEELIVEDCPAITEIIYQDQVVDSGSGTLPSLKKLKLHYLPRLVNIMKGKWPPLENISFYDCPILKKLDIDFIASHTVKEIKAENDWWTELEWQDTSFHLRLQAHFTPICDDDL